MPITDDFALAAARVRATGALGGYSISPCNGQWEALGPCRHRDAGDLHVSQSRLDVPVALAEYALPGTHEGQRAKGLVTVTDGPVALIIG